jgi:hypothetical protein
MSADLFAAFGPHVALDDISKKEREEHTSPDISPTVLIPGIETLDFEQRPDFYQKPSRPKQEDNQPLWRQDDGGTDVLFDATEDAPQADDDFGDFEDANASGENHTASSTSIHATHVSPELSMGSNMPTTDLLGLDEEVINTIDPKATPNLKPDSANALLMLRVERAASKISAEDDWGEFSAPATYEAVLPLGNTIKMTHLMPTKVSEIEQHPPEDDWDAFEDGETEASTHAQVEGPLSGLAATPAAAVPHLYPPPKSNPLSGRTDTQTAEAIRPSNIPPPAILLQLLPGVFDELRQAATQHIRQNPPPPTNLSQHDMARTIIQAFTVAARIIAGRTLRWKRDAILVQSMRIGPAASAGGGRGMKLAALDKSESLKEEKEAADVVGAWEKSAHMFNSTVSKAGMQQPLMALYLSVRPRLTNGFDVLKANHGCALCGINRDERVPQVEIKVEDSFGEYWIEHWGHRDCRDFWTTYKDRLHQR